MINTKDLWTEFQQSCTLAQCQSICINVLFSVHFQHEGSFSSVQSWSTEHKWSFLGRIQTSSPSIKRIQSTTQPTLIFLTLVFTGSCWSFLVWCCQFSPPSKSMRRAPRTHFTSWYFLSLFFPSGLTTHLPCLSTKCFLVYRYIFVCIFTSHTL